MKDLSKLTLEFCKTQTVDQLRALERQLFAALNDHFRAMCAVRYALKLQGQPPPASECQGAFAFYEQVALGTLHPTLAMNLHAHVAVMNAVAKTPLVEQENIVRTQAVVVPRMRQDGTFERQERKIIELSITDQNRVFGPDGIRTFDQQVALLRKQASVTRDRTGAAHRSSSLTMRVDELKSELVYNLIRLDLLKLASVLIKSSAFQRILYALLRGDPDLYVKLRREVEKPRHRVRAGASSDMRA